MYIHDDKNQLNNNYLKSPDLINHDLDDNESNESVQSKKSARLDESDYMNNMRDQDIYTADLKFLNFMESACRATNCDFKHTSTHKNG